MVISNNSTNNSIDSTYLSSNVTFNRPNNNNNNKNRPNNNKDTSNDNNSPSSYLNKASNLIKQIEYIEKQQNIKQLDKQQSLLLNSKVQTAITRAKFDLINKLKQEVEGEAFEEQFNFIKYNNNSDEKENYLEFDEEEEEEGYLEEGQSSSPASAKLSLNNTSSLGAVGNGPFLLPSQYIDLSLFFYSPPEIKQQKNILQLSSDSSDLVSSTTSTASSTNSNQTNSSLTTSDDSDRIMMVMPSTTTTTTITTTNNTTTSPLVANQQQNSPKNPLTQLNGNHKQQQKLIMSPKSIITNLSLNVDSMSSDDHEELLAEMELIERLPTQERLKQAKRRRAIQLKKWDQYEKEMNQLMDQQNKMIVNNSNGLYSQNNNKSKQKNIKNNIQMMNSVKIYGSGVQTKIKFQDHVVLLDAIMRKDYDEVERLLQLGLPPNSANEDGLTAIHQVCKIYLNFCKFVVFRLTDKIQITKKERARIVS
jgi:hypothetical protein